MPTAPSIEATQADLDALLAACERELAPLEDAVLDRPREGGGWTARQVIGHIALTVRLYDERMRARLAAHRGEGRRGARPARSGWFAGLLLRWLPDAARRFKAPKAFDPTRCDEPFDVPVLLAALQGLRATAAEIVERRLEGLRFRTPISPLLRMSLGDGVRVQVVHTRRHLEQVRGLVSEAAGAAS